jgi:chromate transporter
VNKKSRPGATPAVRDLVPFRTAVRTWFLISLETFGGPAGQIAVMQRVLVDEKRWIGHRRFQHALNFCVLLPGPEAQQLAIYIGWLLNGRLGGLVAGILFVLPGMVALLVLSVIYVAFGTVPVIMAVFAGVAAATLPIVAQAVVRVGRRALAHPVLVALAVAAFVALAAFAVPFPAVIAAAGLAGWVLNRAVPRVFAARAEKEEADAVPPVVADNALHAGRLSGARAARILATGLVLWLLPILAVVLWAGPGSVLTHQGLFFSGAAMVTFGGAYAVLSYVAQQAVEVFHWLSPGEMVRGLALAETTPGPLIMVVQFVAFIGAYRNPGNLDPWVAAFTGALLTTWVTFVPCFLFIFLGAPYVERLRGNRTLAGILAGITAAVVGVIANLALYFAIHIFFSRSTALDWGPLHLRLPDPGAVNPVAAVIAAAAGLLIFRFRFSALRTIGVCAVLGLGAGLAGLPLG